MEALSKRALSDDVLQNFDPPLASELSWVYRHMGIRKQELFDALEMYVQSSFPLLLVSPLLYPLCVTHLCVSRPSFSPSVCIYLVFLCMRSILSF